MLSSRSLIAPVRQLHRRRRDDAPTTSRSTALPLYHCAQLHCFLMPGLYLGATNIVLPRRRSRRDPGRDRARAGHEAVLPADGVDRAAAAPRLRPARPVVAAQGLLRRVDHAGRGARGDRRRLPDVRLFNFYGQTEMSPDGDRAARPRTRCASPARPGRPAINVETRVVDDDDGAVPPGEVGEIVHRSPHAMLGLLERPGEDGRGVPQRLVPQRRPRRACDEEGYITVVDRKKDMIKTGGENVASREVEEVLYPHPAVTEVAVFGIPTRSGSRRSPPPSCCATAQTVEPRRADRVLPRAAGALQGAEVLRRRRRATQERQRQDPQARAARHLRGGDRVTTTALRE